jgi:hypothetical protein
MPRKRKSTSISAQYAQNNRKKLRETNPQYREENRSRIAVTRQLCQTHSPISQEEPQQQK